MKNNIFIKILKIYIKIIIFDYLFFNNNKFCKILILIKVFFEILEIKIF
jgi:hypothetical protein